MACNQIVQKNNCTKYFKVKCKDLKNGGCKLELETDRQTDVDDVRNIHQRSNYLHTKSYIVSAVHDHISNYSIPI